MKRKNATLQALFTSILSLVLCVSMLVGSTFAWFTDSVETGMNTIAAGNLDIELLADGVEVNSGTKLFADVDLWEPGVVVYENLQVANVGTLALKYQMTLNFGSENDLNGNKLSDVLQVAVIDAIAEGANRQEVLAAAKASGKIGTLSSFKLSGTLDARDATAEQAIVIFWEPISDEIDNLYNVNNGQKTSDGKPLHIEFGVTLIATQFTKESDSFDENYDGGTKWIEDASIGWYLDGQETGEYVIGSAEDLAGLAAIVNGTATTETATYAADGAAATIQDSFAGKTIKLAADIDLNNGAWTPIGSDLSNCFSGTFDGNGYTISNLNVEGVNNVGLFGYAAYGGNVKNLTVKNATVKANDYAGVIMGRGYTDIDNCHVENATVSVTPYLKGDVYDGGAKAGGIIGQMLEGSGNTVTNCSAKNVKVYGFRDIGGVVGMVHNNNSCSGNTAENITLGYVLCEQITADQNENAGAIYGRVQASATVTPAKDSEENKAFTQVYAVCDVNSLISVASYVNSFSNYEYPFQGETIVLTCDLDLGGMEWTPIGDYRFSANRFCGTFDGQGHTISNFKITKKTDKNDSNKSSYGFFGNVEGTVKNLTVANATVSSYAYCGALIGRLNSGLVENCNVVNANVAPSYWQGGIMIGQVNGGSVKNCTVDNSTISGKSALGGFAGPVTAEDGDILFENCTVKNSAVEQAGSFGGNYDKYFGGMFGYLESGDNRIELNNCSVINTTVKGEVSSQLSGDNEGNIYFDGVQGVTTAEELKEALLDGGDILLGSNIVMESVYITNPNFVLDGNGYTITQSGTNTYALIDTQGGSVTLKNVTFDGINGGAVVRTVGAKFNASNVTVKNSNHTQQQGLFRLMGESTIENCVFKDNNCSMAITLNYDGANNDPQIVKDCVFENNTCNSTAVVYYVKGAGCTLTGNKFIGNTVCTASGNAATLYMGFTENNVITNNLFKGNDVTGTTKRVAGGLMIGYAAEISGNAFIDNTVTGSVEGLGNDVCASVYYTDIDLSGNYWGGSAPVAGDDYYQEYTTHTVIINDYLTDSPF